MIINLTRRPDKLTTVIAKMTNDIIVLHFLEISTQDITYSVIMDEICKGMKI